MPNRRNRDGSSRYWPAVASARARAPARRRAGAHRPGEVGRVRRTKVKNHIHYPNWELRHDRSAVARRADPERGGAERSRKDDIIVFPITCLRHNDKKHITDQIQTNFDTMFDTLSSVDRRDFRPRRSRTGTLRLRAVTHAHMHRCINVRAHACPHAAQTCPMLT